VGRCWNRFALLLALFTSLVPLGCWSLPENTVVIENEGQLCFSRCNPCLDLQAKFRPSGCFSSSCTEVLDRSVSGSVDAVSSVIQVDARFVLLLPEGSPRLCTADCGGAGSVTTHLGEVIEGTYSIWLGSERLGELIVPAQPDGAWECFENQ
jgi:hypothetical protein